MILLKDWNKLNGVDGQHTWVNVRKEWDTLSQPLVDVRRVYKDRDDLWRTEIFGEHRTKVYKSFKKESDGVKFAESYMRSH